MQKSIEKLSMVEVTVLLSSTILGARVFSMPRTVVETIHTADALLVVFINGTIFIIIGLLFAKFAARNPTKTIFDLNREVAGKVIGSLLNGYMIIYFLGGVGYEVRSLGEVTSYFLLPETPLIVIVSIFVLIGMFYIRGTFFSIAKLIIYIFPFTMIVYFILMTLSVKIFDIKNLLPFLGEGVSPLLSEFPKTFSFFSGFEMILFLVPWMKKKSEAKKATIIGIGMVTIFYCFTLFIIGGGMSVTEIQSATWPIITLIQDFEIEGVFIQRFDMFLLIIWILQIFTTQLAFLYGAFLGYKSLFNKLRDKWILLILFVFSVGSAMYPSNINELFSLERVLSYGFIGILLIPLLLFCLQFFQSKLGRKTP